MPEPDANIARHLGAMAAAQPGTVALKVPRGRNRSGEIDYLGLTFAQLDQESSAWCARLTTGGVRPGDRTLVMVKPGLPLIAAVFALFRLGAVPVVLDPGMTLRNFLPCVARTKPRALVGIPIAGIVSRIFRKSFRDIEVRVGASSPVARLGGTPVRSAAGAETPRPPPTSPDSLAAILFTSGSTGAPKGVCYTHAMFDAQVRMIRSAFAIEPGEIDLPILPVFALFNPALGLTTIVPEIDPRRPARADPAKLVQAIRQEGVTNSFASPAVWARIVRHCRDHGIALPTLRRVLCAGAPVSRALWTDSTPIIPNGRLHSPYGATEALPVSSIDSREAIASFAQGGTGACVGRPLPETEVRIIAPVEGPIATLAGAREVSAGQVGEIIVKGPQVTRLYDQLPEATARAKIADGEAVWHRMGDCGHFDSEGRIWFCGRLAEVVAAAGGPMFTEPCEQVFRPHPGLTRCALIGLGAKGAQVPALVVEAVLEKNRQKAMAAELRALARGNPATAVITRFYFHPKFPVDTRHNAKIHRLTLAKWAKGTTDYIDVP